MEFVKLHYPGIAPVLPDGNIDDQLMSVFFALEGELSDVVLAFNFFHTSKPIPAKGFLHSDSESGMPGELGRRLPFFFANSFIFSLDRILNILDRLSELPNIPSEVVEQKRSLEDEFQQVKGVRDSIAHIDERIFGKARNKRISFAGVFEIGNISADKLGNAVYCFTTANGQSGEVEISPRVLGKLQAAIQKIINAFKWQWPPRDYPGNNIDIGTM